MNKMAPVSIVVLRDSGFGQNSDGIWREFRQNSDSSRAATGWPQTEVRQLSELDSASERQSRVREKPTWSDKPREPPTLN
jgi:hypothetical protein